MQLNVLWLLTFAPLLSCLIFTPYRASKIRMWFPTWKIFECVQTYTWLHGCTYHHCCYIFIRDPQVWDHPFLHALLLAVCGDIDLSGASMTGNSSIRLALSPLVPSWSTKHSSWHPLFLITWLADIRCLLSKSLIMHYPWWSRKFLNAIEWLYAIRLPAFNRLLAILIAA